MGETIPGAEKKIPAGILGILLGGLGVHRFYLGLIEGILYLTKTDADFVQTYLVEKKEWF